MQVAIMVSYIHVVMHPQEKAIRKSLRLATFQYTTCTYNIMHAYTVCMCMHVHNHILFRAGDIYT